MSHSSLRLSAMFALFIAFTAIWFAMGGQSALAQNTELLTAGDRAVVIDTDVNLRTHPEIGAAVVITLGAGDFVTILSGPIAGSDFNWYEVETDSGASGYIVTDFLQWAPHFALAEEVVSGETGLELFGTPTLSSEVLATVDEGIAATIVDGPAYADAIEWYLVEFDSGLSGWASSQQFARVVRTNASFPIDSFVIVHAPFSQLHFEPGFETTVLATIVEGAVSRVAAGPVEVNGAGWYRVIFENESKTLEGWLDGYTLAGGIFVGGSAIAAEESVNVRIDAYADAESVAELTAGEVVTVVAGPLKQDDIVWFLVETDTIRGYVAGWFLGPLDSDD